MAVTNTQTPKSVNFTKNFIPVRFVSDNFSGKENYTIVVKIRIDVFENDGSAFDTIDYTTLQLSVSAHSGGTASTDLAEILHSYLEEKEPDFPDFGSVSAKLCHNSIARFSYQYGEMWGDMTEPIFSGISPRYIALYGGLSYRAAFNTEMLDLICPDENDASKDRFLRQGNSIQYTRSNQPQFLSFFNSREAQTDAVLKTKLYYKDETDITKTITVFDLLEEKKYSFNLTYDTVFTELERGKQAVKYEFWLEDSLGNKLSETRTFYLNYEYREYSRYFMYWSCWGAFDTRLTYGKGNSELELFQQEAKRIRKAGYSITDGDTRNFDIKINSGFKVATGWMGRRELAMNRDFFLSPFKFRYTGGLLLPISITSKTIPEIPDGSGLIAQSFEYKYNFDDDCYTEGDVEDNGESFDGFFFYSNPVINPTGGFQETDPTVPWWVKAISIEQIAYWNNGGSTGDSWIATQLSYDANKYLYLSGEKIKAGFADSTALAIHALNADHALNANYAIEANHSVNADLATYALDADKWDGQQFIDFINQPVRTNDSPKFEGVSSPLFVSGAFGSGYRIAKSGDKYTLELDNLIVRDGFTATELTINKIRSSNGAIAVTDAGVIKSLQVVDVGQFNITLEGDNVPFLVNDILKCQVFTGTGIKSYYLLVLSISSTVISVVKIQGGAISTGDTIVRVGNNTNTNRQGLIYLTNSDSGAPYLDVLDGVDGTSFTGKTKVRLGKLDGIVDPDFGALSGYGIYAERGFFKGSIQVTGGNAATKSYAETQALNAKNEANSYTSTQFNVLDGKINLKADQTTVTGLDARLSSAELKITPEAINITVSSQVDNKVNAVQVGGRNLFLNSKRTFETTFRERIYVSEPLTPGETYTVTMNGIRGEGATLSIWGADGYEPFVIMETLEGIQTVTNTFVYNGAAGNHDKVWIYSENSPNPSTFYWAKIVKGNKSTTDWSPAPEDVQSEIEARPTEAQIQAGISITPGAINIFGQELSLAGKVTFSSLDAGAQNQINVIAQDKVDNIQVGGRNYILNSNVSHTDINSATFLNFSEHYTFFQGKTMTLSCDCEVVNGQFGFNDRFGVEIAIQTPSETLYFGTWEYITEVGQSTKRRLSATLIMPDVIGATINLGMYVQAYGDLVKVSNPKLEIGTKATDWTPAPEDEANARIALANSLKAMAFEEVVEIGKLGESVVDGGIIKGEVLDALYIRSVIVNAAYIQTIDLTADKITAGRLQSIGGGSYFDLNNNVLSTNNLLATGGNIGGFGISQDSLNVEKSYGSSTAKAYIRLLTSGDNTQTPTLMIGHRFPVGQIMIQEDQLIVDKDGCYFRDAEILNLKVTGGIVSSGSAGLNISFNYRDGNDHFNLTFKNGILTNRYQV